MQLSRALLLSISLYLIPFASRATDVTTPSEAALQQAIHEGGLVRLSFDGMIGLTSTLEITKDVVLDAHGHSVTISGNNAVRLIHVNPGVSFSATNVVFANGRHVGANGDPGQPGLPGEGGAILSEGGVIQLVCCTLTNNSAIGGTGGTNSINGSGEGRGGALAVRGGSLLLNSVTLSSNSACGGVGTPKPIDWPPGFNMPDTSGHALGGAAYITNASVQLYNCLLTSNICTALGGGSGAKAHGGAVYVTSGSLLISNSCLNGNTAYGGDALSPTGYLAMVWGEASSGYGGAIGAFSGTVTLERCQFNLNSARGGALGGISGKAQGGAVFSTATLVASDSSFSQNRALAGSSARTESEGHGGALYNLGSAALTGCSFISNVVSGGSGDTTMGYRPGGASGLGGGIFNGAQMTMTNCTVALNVARGGGSTSPFYPGKAIGGGIFNTNGTTMAINVTVASNCVSPGVWGIPPAGSFAGANLANQAGTIYLRNSILAYPIGTNWGNGPFTPSNAWGTVTDGGYNLSSDATANFSSSSSLNSTDPRLLPLADNGGPTMTMALATNSPAIDKGTSIGTPLADQRGFPRTGKAYDIGAFERQPTSKVIPKLSLTRQQGGLALRFTSESGITYALRYSTNLTSWTELEKIGPYKTQTPIIHSLGTNAQPNGYYRIFVP